MEIFQKLLEENLPALERYVKFKISNKHDAEDILQDVCLTATLKVATLQSPTSMKAWLIGIARHKCMDYYRKKARGRDISLQSLSKSFAYGGRLGITPASAVRETVNLLCEKDKQILSMFYFSEMTQKEIAHALSIPLGTVKSRLYYAQKKFKEQYPYLRKEKGERLMNKLPTHLPGYTIELSEQEPFPVCWEELQGWLLVPRVGEKLTWGLFEMPSRKRTEYTEMEAIGRAEIHGIGGVEIAAVQYGAEDYYRTGLIDRIERRFIAQLTDTHCRYLAESHIENGVRKVHTFLDGDEFLENWGFGENNCGNEVNLQRKGLLRRTGNTVEGHPSKETVDIVGRYTVTIGEKIYDTVCVMDIQCFNDGVASEQYLDKNGRTVLWRRFNKNDWGKPYFSQPWAERLPENERLIINGETYVHWYDCVSDYIF